VREARTLTGIVAFVASVGLVASRTNGVDFLLRLGGANRLVDIMTVIAVLLPVAVDTPQAKQLYMFLMVKCHGRRRLVRCVINFLGRHINDWVRLAHNIGGIMIGAIGQLPAQGIVANDTLRIMAPLTVAAKTLPMVCPFQAWLAEVGHGRLGVTFTARWYPPGRTVMMTCFATLAHVRHVGVHLVIKMHGAVFIYELVQ
jgi:hypothetical protein